jgi:hypothetical protein
MNFGVELRNVIKRFREATAGESNLFVMVFCNDHTHVVFSLTNKL